MKEIKAPLCRPKDDECNKVFLAGSIEMGAAEKWQDKVVASLQETNYVLFNPRRDDWDSSWIQSVNNENFYGQVLWELNAMEEANIILFYFDKNTKSPITLMELGLQVGLNFNNKGNKILIVCCPEGFWRKGNVDILCQKYNHSRLLQVNSLEEMINTVKYLVI